VVVDDDAAVAIEDAPARRRHRLRFYAVGESALVIKLGILNLKPPEAGDEKHERNDGGVLKNGDLARYLTVVVAQGWLADDLGLEIWIDRRQGHNTRAQATSSLSV